jgi:hypothetical protein
MPETIPIIPWQLTFDTYKETQPSGRAGQQDHCPHLQRRGRLGQRLRHGDFGQVAGTRTAVPRMVCLKENFALGQVQFVQVADDTWVANIIGQRDTRKDAAATRPSATTPWLPASQGRAVCPRKGRRRTHAPHRLRPCRGHVGPDRTADPAHLSAKDIAVTVYDFA